MLVVALSGGEGVVEGGLLFVVEEFGSIGQSWLLGPVGFRGGDEDLWGVEVTGKVETVVVGFGNEGQGLSLGFGRGEGVQGEDQGVHLYWMGKNIMNL